MEVDRISRMGCVVRQSTPRWPDSAKRRRHFSEELLDSVDAQDSEEDPAGDAGSETSASEQRPATPFGGPKSEKRSGGGFDVLA